MLHKFVRHEFNLSAITRDLIIIPIINIYLLTDDKFVKSFPLFLSFAFFFKFV